MQNKEVNNTKKQDMGPLMRLEHGEEERRMLASDLAPHLHAWVQDSPLLQLEVKENLLQEKNEEGDKQETCVHRQWSPQTEFP